MNESRPKAGFSRRQLLRGAGVALALPFLHSLAPRGSAAQAAARRRYVSLYFPNGTAEFWRPAGAGGTGDAWKLSPILEPLAPVKRHLTVLTNVANYSTFGGPVQPSHSNCGAATWTCVRANGQNKNDSGISVDQVIAAQIGAATRLPSIQVGLSTLDSFTDGLPGQHSRSMSWKSAREPLYKQVNPQAVFDRLTAGGAVEGPAVDQAAATRRRALQRSVLDFVLDDASRLQQRLGAGDRAKLDQYLTSVRSLEKRVAEPGMQLAATSCRPTPRPPAAYSVGNVPAGYNRDTHAGLMIDLVALAFQCDLTRVCSFMLDDARSDFVYDFLSERKFTDAGSTPGTSTVRGYHGLQHAGDRNNGFATIGWWNAQKAAQLAGKLAEMEDGEGRSVLDDTVIVFASGMHGGNHDPGDLPIALLGSGGGVLATDRHAVFASEQRLADVHLTIMRHVFGCTQPSFGSSSGVISDLLR
jgi:hypothetical protein